jgi:ABC-type antimicrobial peptide transport system permease subunit
VLYLSYRQMPWPFMTVLIEPAAGGGPAVAALREEIARIDPAQAIGPPRPLDEIRREWLVLPRLRLRIVALFGASALLLTLAGLYARVSYATGARAREVAIRQAVGARPADVVRSLAGEAVLLVLAGAAIGLALLPGVQGLTQAIVGRVAETGAALPASVSALFVTAAAASACWPACRAIRTNPADVLRAD